MVDLPNGSSPRGLAEESPHNVHKGHDSVEAVVSAAETLCPWCEEESLSQAALSYEI